MRPIRLEMSAFGPYAGLETVDFTRLGESGLYFCFIVRVSKGGGLVHDQDGGIFQHGAGNGNALLLAAGQIHALGANDGMDTRRKFLHNIHALCSF